MDQIRSKINSYEKLRKQLNQENDTQTGRNAQEPNNRSWTRIIQEKTQSKYTKLNMIKRKEKIPKLEHGSEGWLILGLTDEMRNRLYEEKQNPRMKNPPTGDSKDPADNQNWNQIRLRARNRFLSKESNEVRIFDGWVWWLITSNIGAVHFFNLPPRLFY